MVRTGHVDDGLYAYNRFHIAGLVKICHKSEGHCLFFNDPVSMIASQNMYQSYRFNAEERRVNVRISFLARQLLNLDMDGVCIHLWCAGKD
jgi:hypothetical protein